MTGLFLSKYVSRRDGWCINRCLEKLCRTSSSPLEITSVFINAFNLYRPVWIWLCIVQHPSWSPQNK